jgi:hypothetical protein
MEFKLNEYHQGVSDNELLDDVRRVSKQLNGSYLSIKSYEKVGNYSETTFRKHFGSWINVLKLAGLKTSRTKVEMQRISDKELIEDCLHIARLLSKNIVTTTDYQIYGKYSLPTVIERFDEWSKFIEKVGLQSTGFKKKVSDEELYKEIERIWIVLGKQPTTTDMKKDISQYSLDTFMRRFGGWRNALLAFLEHINSDIEFIENEDNLDNKTIEEGINNEKGNSDAVIVKHKTPRNINDRIRFKVLQRDDFKCRACGASPAIIPGVLLHVDHIIPWSKGGETVLDNLQTLCSKCNLGKSDLLQF